MLNLYFNEKDQDKVSVRAYKILMLILKENSILKELLYSSETYDELTAKIKMWVYDMVGKESNAIKYYNNDINGREALRSLSWKEVAAVRVLDYLKNSGREIEDGNIKNRKTINQPFYFLWLATKFGTGGAKYDFFIDMLELFRQFNGSQKHEIPSKEKVFEWMDRHPAGTDTRIAEIRKENKIRILKVVVNRISSGEWADARYNFTEGLSEEQKLDKAIDWWDDWHFHLKFAIRDPEVMNEMLNNSLMSTTIAILNDAKKVGIPFFVNPYYLSLINVREYEMGPGIDQAIRDYVFYSRALIEEFGEIVAWEKEDTVMPGEPNPAGWILPSQHNMHRRYPEVAILIPDTAGRACGGLCVSCQRMYDFQSGHLNFNLDKLQPKPSWDQKLSDLMNYFENDSKLRDILITGGDAFMNSDKSLKKILDAVYDMAVRKIEANKLRPDGEKYAEMLRIRLGTRLPVYLPQRVTDELMAILAEFKRKASLIGFKQFVIQTHFVSAMEITPEAELGLNKLQSAGWLVTNQMVFSAAASVHGHSPKLRKVLNDVGVVSYYTFSVKGFKENSYNFATNARAVQESVEEKIIGAIPNKYVDQIKEFPLDAEHIKEKINTLRNNTGLPFLATDRTVMNIPGVGKSLSYRVIGITRFGHRILEFEHDVNRSHSPIIETMGNFVVVESKTMCQYLRQIEKIGEDPKEYNQIYGYSIGETEPRMPIYEYPEYDFKVTSKYTNLEM